MANQAPFLRYLRLVDVLFLCAYVGLVIYFEVPFDVEPVGNKCELSEKGDPGVSTSMHKMVLASGFRNVRSRHVTVVPFNEETVPPEVLNNVCEQRWFMARLLRRLEVSRVAVIAIDKFFDPKSCREGDIGTRDLISAVQHSPTPIVVGTATHIPPADPNNACLIVSRSLDFGSSTSLHWGLTRLNSDPRKVPLGWFVYADDAAFTAMKSPSVRQIESLSYRTATLVDSGLQNEPQMQTLLKRGLHPFTSFIEPSAIPHIDALKYLCSGPDKPTIESRYSGICNGKENADVEVMGRVVVIGEDYAGRDRHGLLGKDVSGLYLQANYIESLLDGRYFKPLAPGWNIALSVAWVAFFYVLFWRLPPERALFICAVAAIITWFVIVELVRWTGFYPDIRLQRLGSAALLLRYADARGAQIRGLFKKQFWRKKLGLYLQWPNRRRHRRAA